MPSESSTNESHLDSLRETVTRLLGVGNHYFYFNAKDQAALLAWLLPAREMASATRAHVSERQPPSVVYDVSRGLSGDGLHVQGYAVLAVTPCGYRISKSCGSRDTSWVSFDSKTSENPYTSFLHWAKREYWRRYHDTRRLTESTRVRDGVKNVLNVIPNIDPRIVRWVGDVPTQLSSYDEETGW